MRQQMKLVEAKLRTGLQKIAARDNNAVSVIERERMDTARRNWRLLKVDA